MNPTDNSVSERFSTRGRVGLAALAVTLALPLGVAMVLTPDRHGSGTHQQLGLPPCTFKVLTGLPCPSCGMTTSWAHVVRGEIVGALRANVGGTLLCVVSLAVVPWLIASAAAGRWIAIVPREGPIAWTAVAFVLITLVDWGIRLAMH